MEIAERAAAERKRRAEEADRLRQSRLDQALLETYRSIEDLDGRRERELRDLDRSIGVLRAREAELIEHQRKLIVEATNTDNSEVAARLETDIRLLDSEIVAQSSVVAAKLRERNAVVERFASLREANLADLDAMRLGADDLWREGLHPTLGTVTMRQLLATWVVHDHNHLAQLQGALAAHYVREVGPWRSFLGILDRVEP